MLIQPLRIGHFGICSSWAIAFLEMPNAVAYTMYRPHNVMSSTPRSVKSLKSVR